MNGRQVCIPFPPTIPDFPLPREERRTEAVDRNEADTQHTDALQIKHAVGSARSIARENNQPLDMRHISSVLEVVEAWNVAKAIK